MLQLLQKNCIVAKTDTVTSMPALTIENKTMNDLENLKEAGSVCLRIAGHGCLVKIIIIDYYPTCLLLILPPR